MEGSYSETVEALKDGSKVILVHGNADMDAIGSAHAISRTFGDCTIFAPNGQDRVSKMVTEKLGIKVLEECDITTFDKVVVVDTSSPDQLLPLTGIPEDAVVIDHHMLTGKWAGHPLLCDETLVACTQVVLRLIRECGKPVDKETGLALIGGMITDSGHFQFADACMLRDFADVMDEAGIDMDQAYNFTRMDIGMSERVAMMKCVERSRFDRVGDMIVAVSYGGSFEASGCRALSQSGADVVFVGSQRDDTYRISARATQEMIRRGIHLGEIMKSLGDEIDADGGGHGGAAGMSGSGDVEAALHICMQRTMEEFRRIKKAGEMASEDRSDEPY